MDRKSFDPTVFLSDGQDYILHELLTLRIPVIDVAPDGWNELATARLVPHLRRLRPAIVHSWMFTANTWARVAGTVARVPVIITSERGMELTRKRAHHAIDLALNPLADAVIVNAHMLREHVHRRSHVSYNKIHVIHNGVDTDRYGRAPLRADARDLLGLPTHLPVVGMAASFFPYKRWDVYMDAVRRLAQSHHFHAVCVGDGPLRGAMEERARELGIGDHVTFLGVQSDMPTVMAALDILLHSSDEEGLPNVIMEAMASSLPVVATDAGGTRELVIDGQTGFVTPLGDAQALAERAGLLLSDAGRARQYGSAGRDRVEREFTFARCVRQTESLYNSLLAAKSLQATGAGA